MVTRVGNQLVERDDDLAALSQLAAQTALGTTRIALVTGESGLGKTSLVRAFADSLPDGWQHTWVDHALTAESWISPLRDLVGTPTLSGDDSDPSVVLAARIRAAIEAHGQQGPHLLGLEDLQFFDPTVIDALGHLLDRHSDAPLLVVATYRLGARPIGSAHSRAVASLLRRRHAVEVRLAPLSFGGTRAVAAAVGFDRADQDFHQRCGGNPFLVQAAAHSAGASARTPLDSLSAGALRLARLLALAGRPLPARAARHLDPTGTAAAELASRLVAVVNSEQVRLRHAMVADVLAAEIDPASAAPLHGELAAALALVPGVDDEVRARHLHLAGDLDAAAVLAARAADRLAGEGHHRSATELYQLALAGQGWTDSQRASLLERALVSAARAGDTTAAIRLRITSKVVAVASDDAELVDTRFSNPLFQRLARDLHRRTTADEPPMLSPEARAAATADLVASQDRLNAGDWTEAARHAQWALDLLGGHDDVLESDAWFALGYAGDPVRAAQGLDAVAARALAGDDIGSCTSALARSAVMHMASANLPQAMEVSRRSLRVARRHDDPAFWGSIQAGTASLHAAAGELDAAMRLADELQTLGQPIIALLGQAVMWMVALDRGDLARSRELADVLLPIVRAVDDRYFTVPMFILGGRTHALAGELEQAAQILAEAEAALWSPVHDKSTEFLVARIEVALDTDDHEVLHRCRQRAEVLAGNLQGPGAAALGAYAAGAIAMAVDGDPVRAGALFAHAGDSFGLATRRALLVDARCRQLECVLAAASNAEAVDVAAAQAAVAETRQLIERFGIGAASTRLVRLATGVDALGSADPLARLDARERHAVQRAAQGRSNREIAAELYLAEKTVRNLLTGAFAKLGVQRRAQLAAMLAGPER